MKKTATILSIFLFSSIIVSTASSQIIVTNAGTAIVNGTYNFSSEYNGKNAYLLGADVYLIWLLDNEVGNSGEGWFFYSAIKYNDDVYYYNSNDWGVDPPVSGWTDTGCIGDTPMPLLAGDVSLSVELACFSAQVTDQSVQLQWTTESEEGNLGFILYRKPQEDTDWAIIASYEIHDALKGQGNTSSRTEYTFSDVNVFVGQTYNYRLSDVNFEGVVTIQDVLEITVTDIVIPNETVLNPAFPNPFNPQTKISYKLAEKASVFLNVYDINGRLVSGLMDGIQQSPGSYSIHWNGKNDLGQHAATGTYILRMIAGEVVEMQKVLLIR